MAIPKIMPMTKARNVVHHKPILDPSALTASGEQN